MAIRVGELAARMAAAYGDLGWWPGDSPFAVAVGAVLTQNTTWTQAEKALNALAAAGALAPPALATADRERLEAWIRPAGTFRQKAERLQRLAAWWRDHVGAADDRPDDTVKTAALRAELRGLKGIGPETADAIVAYAFLRPVLVVDAYTARLAVRLGLLDGAFGYDELQQRFGDDLPADGELLRNLHAQIVEHMKTRCTRRAPRCDDCFLRDECQGPIDLAE